jgi:hypothetical protein
VVGLGVALEERTVLDAMASLDNDNDETAIEADVDKGVSLDTDDELIGVEDASDVMRLLLEARLLEVSTLEEADVEVTDPCEVKLGPTELLDSEIDDGDGLLASASDDVLPAMEDESLEATTVDGTPEETVEEVVEGKALDEKEMNEDKTEDTGLEDTTED